MRKNLFVIGKSQRTIACLPSPSTDGHGYHRGKHPAGVGDLKKRSLPHSLFNNINRDTGGNIKPGLNGTCNQASVCSVERYTGVILLMQAGYNAGDGLFASGKVLFNPMRDTVGFLQDGVLNMRTQRGSGR